ncbi:hypothetical protein ES702_00458 [subsurface metagenome]
MISDKTLRKLEKSGLLWCPHCYNAGKLMAFATFQDLQRHVRKGCVTYRYRR